MILAAPIAPESHGGTGAVEEHLEEETIPPLLTVYLADEEVGSPEEQQQTEEGLDGASESPVIIKASRVSLNPMVLDEIDAHAKPASEMPIVRVEVFDDLVVDVEFLNAQPKWKPGEITYDEAGKPTDVQMVSDGTLIRGKLLEPHTGYIVLRTRDDGVSIGALNVDGIGNIEIYRAGAPMHRAMLMEYPQLTCGVGDDATEDEPGDYDDAVEWRVYIIRITDDEGDLSFEIVRVIDDTEVIDYTPDGSTNPVVAGNGRFVAFDMASTGTDPRQVFVHENAKLLGDLNGDGDVAEPDLLILLAQWGDCACCAGDLDGSGAVGVPDLLVLTSNWTGETEP